MKPCVKYQKGYWLDAYGELEPEARRDLARHLAACPGCRHERNALLDLIGRAVRTHPIPVLTLDESARLTGNIMRALETSNARRAWWRPGFFRPTFGWAHLAAAACLILAVIGGFWAWQGANTPFRTAAGPSMEEQVLVEDLEVIENLDLLEEFEELEKLVQLTESPAHGELFPDRQRRMGKEGVSGEMRRRHVV
jgi:hypothetical protein